MSPSPDVRVWVRSSSLQHLVLPHPPPSSLSLASLASLTYCPSTLTLATWTQLLQQHLGVAKQLAQLYWTMALDSRQQPEILWMKQEKEEQEQELPVLLLFLFLQLTAPAPAPAPALTPAGGAGPGPKSCGEDRVFQHVCLHLEQLGTVLGQGSVQHMAVLDMLLGLQVQGKESSFSSGGCDLAGLVSRLEPDLQGLHHCIRSGKRLSWSLACSRAKLATTAHLLPRSSPMVVISQLSGSSLARREGALSGARLVLHRCRNSSLSLLAPLASVTVTKCSDCTLVLGPVQTTVSLAQCSNLTLVTPCRRLLLRDCRDCRIFLHTPRPPVMASCSMVSLAPLSCSFPAMEQHLQEVGLAGSWTSCFSCPLVLGPDSKVLEEQPPGAFTVLPPSSYHLSPLPFQGMEVEEASIDAFLPCSYREEVSLRRARVQEWEGRKETLSVPQRAVLESRVAAMFQSYLAKHSDLDVPSTESI